MVEPFGVAKYPPFVWFLVSFLHFASSRSAPIVGGADEAIDGFVDAAFDNLDKKTLSEQISARRSARAKSAFGDAAFDDGRP